MMGNKVFWGLALVVAGVILLFVNLGYISLSVFFRLFHLWPLLLIAIGINILFKNNRIISYISWIGFFVIIIAYSLYGHTSPNPNMMDNKYIEIERFVETKYGKLNLEIGASRINVDDTDNQLLSADLKGRELDFRKDFTSNNESAVIDFKSKSFNLGVTEFEGSDYDFYLYNDLIWDLDMDFGAISGQINLEDIPVKKLDLELGAADLSMTLGSKHDLELSVEAGASDLSLIIPQDVGLKIEMDSALSATNIGDLNLISQGDYYISSNYDTANVKIDMDISMGVGNINFSYK